jgi:CPA2 family monovalent cation:H+ antiporter-2
MKVRDVQEALRTGSPSSPETDGSARNVPLVTLSERQHQSTRCSHTGQAKDVIPGSRGCGECLQLGDTWVHLRICMTCGNVGCCDSSKNKHATRHHGSTGHPIMKSHQPGEDWAWCDEDRIQF